ncbi:HdeD family acid-resistance protein [Streptomyces sp. MUM 203J]|uniref:HdeD family acid-resistance protein n=1 Tax=Streptomyces sp. MUM 203J TaxID=2791990 RepID=UPI001F048668|nr:HdeD family acid-resistance protein [Streptomyces sp. MUM 203J]MCH0541673.1 HdeD family acid-resistance protein [Streptomyces sp. MUM 203J]
MTAATHEDPAARAGRKLRRSFGWLTLLGAILAVGGVFGLLYTAVATITSMLLFGWLLLIGGAVGLLHALESRGTGFYWLAVVVAALNIAAGFIIIRHPEESAAAFTMFAALLFLTGGLFRLVGSVVVRGPQFGWTLFQGAFGILLGLLVLFDWPHSSLYVLGTFFSLALLFDGLGLIAMGVGGRRIVGLVTDQMLPSEDPGPGGPEAGAPGTGSPQPPGSGPDQSKE